MNRTTEFLRPSSKKATLPRSREDLLSYFRQKRSTSRALGEGYSWSTLRQSWGAKQSISPTERVFSSTQRDILPLLTNLEDYIRRLYKQVFDLLKQDGSEELIPDFNPDSLNPLTLDSNMTSPNLSFIKNTQGNSSWVLPTESPQNEINELSQRNRGSFKQRLNQLARELFDRKHRKETRYQKNSSSFKFLRVQSKVQASISLKAERELLALVKVFDTACIKLGFRGLKKLLGVYKAGAWADKLEVGRSFLVWQLSTSESAQKLKISQMIDSLLKQTMTDSLKAIFSYSEQSKQARILFCAIHKFISIRVFHRFRSLQIYSKGNPAFKLSLSLVFRILSAKRKLNSLIALTHLKLFSWRVCKQRTHLKKIIQIKHLQSKHRMQTSFLKWKFTNSLSVTSSKQIMRLLLLLSRNHQHSLDTAFATWLECFYIQVTLRKLTRLLTFSLSTCFKQLKQLNSGIMKNCSACTNVAEINHTTSKYFAWSLHILKKYQNTIRKLTLKVNGPLDEELTQLQNQLDADVETLHQFYKKQVPLNLNLAKKTVKHVSFGQEEGWFNNNEPETGRFETSHIHEVYQTKIQALEELIEELGQELVQENKGGKSGGLCELYQTFEEGLVTLDRKVNEKLGKWTETLHSLHDQVQDLATRSTASVSLHQHQAIIQHYQSCMDGLTMELESVRNSRVHSALDAQNFLPE